MLLRHFFTPGLFINSYLIFDEETRRGCVIDPTREIEVYLSRAMQEGIEITDIIETHVHADFVSGAPELKAALSGKPLIHCSGLGGKEWVPTYADHVVQNKDVVELGLLRLEAWHTPGHTPEHVMWVVYDGNRSTTVPEIVFTGDLLFVGSVGRPDIFGQEAEKILAKQLYQSLFAVLYALPDFLEIYPAHGAGSLCGKKIGIKPYSTLGYEKRCNSWLMPQNYSHWLNSLQLGSLIFPQYFNRMKQVNIKGLEVSKHQELPLLLTKEQVKKLLKSDLIVDVRRPDDFAAGNIKGSINIPLAPAFPLWAGAALPANQDLLLVVDHPQAVISILQSLKLVGLDRISGVIDVSHWRIDDKKEMFKPSFSMNVETLHAEKENIYLLDVRNRQEWDAGHIEGAHHLDLFEAFQSILDIPTFQPVAVICHSGNRASIIASLLEKEREVKVFNVKGGMQAWNKAKLPVTS